MISCDLGYFLCCGYLICTGICAHFILSALHWLLLSPSSALHQKSKRCIGEAVLPARQAGDGGSIPTSTAREIFVLKKFLICSVKAFFLSSFVLKKNDLLHKAGRDHVTNVALPNKLSALYKQPNKPTNVEKLDPTLIYDKSCVDMAQRI